MQTASHSGFDGMDTGTGPAAETVAVLMAVLDRLRARTVLDLGCGDGRIAGDLAQRGMTVTGLDPSAQALARARRLAPQVRFLRGRAEALPYGLTGFDAAVFVNSLHHIPPDGMARAVLNAADAVRDGGVVLVIEPVAQGSFFRAMRPVEDESIARAQAHRTVEALISSGRVVLRELRRWNRESRFAGLDAFVDYLARASPERAASAVRNETRLARAWRDNIRSQDGKAVLVQPMICWTLTSPRHRATLGPS